MKRFLLFFVALSCAAFAADLAPAPFAEYSLTIESLGPVTVIDPAGEPGYRVRLAAGRVTAFPAHSGSPSQANAAADIAHALANPAPPPVPPSVTRRQLLLALNAQGITRAEVRAQLEAIPDATAREAALIEFDEASTFERGHALVAALATAFGLNSTQADNLFRTAAAL